jgi:uroporphyrinogen-III decarboxylase
MATVTHRDYIHRVFERQCEVALQNLDRLAAAVGNRVQVAFVTGTDFGTQTGQFLSVETYRQLYQPFHKAVNDRIHALTTWKPFIHSCGAVHPLIPEFIEAGFEVINPVQCSAKGMDPRTLKREFGKDLVFWGGGVDTQKTLPFGTPEEVYREVRERIEIFSEGGGYVFNSTHNVQSNVPTANLLAMFRAITDSIAGRN